MAKQVINIGSAPNDGTGDTLREAMDKANDNFTELYAAPSGGVESVTGDGVDNTDPDNPIISFPSTGDIGAQPALGFTPENVANKATDFTTVNDTLYPSVKAVNDKINASVEGLQNKADSRVATTANITLSGIQTIDGVLLIAGDRVLVKDQSAASENGIYVSAVGAWSRSGDTNTGVELRGAVTSIDEGTLNADTTWRQTADNITVGSTSITWVQYGAAVPDATSTTKGKARLYPSTSLGANTDGAPDQNAVKVYVDAKITQVITNGVTTTAPSEDAVFDALALKAPLNSPTFTGTPIAPTATAGTSTTQIATTAFVSNSMGIGNLLYMYNNFI